MNITPNGSHLEPATGSPDNVPVRQPPASKVFSLFLSPEQRRLKLETENAAKELASQEAKAKKLAAATAKSGLKQGRPLKASKVPAKLVKVVTRGGSAEQPDIDTRSSSVPENKPQRITGSTPPNVPIEPHPFFLQSTLVHSSESGTSMDGSEACHRSRRVYSTGPPPFASKSTQFHDIDLAERLCGVMADFYETTLPQANANNSQKLVHKDFGWYSLRLTSQHDTATLSTPTHIRQWKGSDQSHTWHNNLRVRPPLSARPLLDDQEGLKTDEDILNPVSQRKTNSKRCQHAGNEFESCRRFDKGESAFETRQFADDAGELWTDKYRPKRAVDVVGNKLNAEYLSRWLKALEISGWSLNPEESAPAFKKTLSGLERPRKKRATGRSKGSDLDGFVVYDDFGSEIDDDSDLDDFVVMGNLRSGSRQATERTSADLEFMTSSDELRIRSNTIILSGPTGSCKTSALYACAAECGYEVFEVSPGSRRTGKDLLSLVGEMAENHHVQVIGRSDKQEIGESSKQEFNEACFQEEAYMNVGVDSPSSTPILKADTLPTAKQDEFQEDSLSDLYSLLSTANPRQSLILLEEVDILFEEDRGFWPSVLALVDRSKRPVVMTCNDPSKVPLMSLRLQMHLQFQLPSQRELEYYLGNICEAEGIQRTPAYLSCLIQQCGCDVRKALFQLQFGLSDPEEANLPETDTLEVKYDLHRKHPDFVHDLTPQLIYLNGMSKLDAYLDIRAKRLIELQENDQYEAGKDDVVGARVLFKSLTQTGYPFFEGTIFDCAIAGEIALLKGSHHDFDYYGFPARKLAGFKSLDNFKGQKCVDFEARNLTQSKMDLALEATLTGSQYRLGTTAAFQEFAPMLRAMAEADQAVKAISFGKRSMRSGGQVRRHLQLQEHESRMLLSTRIKLVDENEEGDIEVD